ncbi:MAG: ATP-grasp peptide maturase system methyltransferase [Micromonosporaceae bacterium]|nr:ATP-grasp peptide maturase system methyltransferase [Micromonosporaceae bacterium]
MVETLATDGDLASPAWRKAFAAVPRHLFLPRFYRQTTDLAGWEPIDQHHPDWLNLVYTNQTWVTQLDHDDQRWAAAVEHGSATGVPTSSSTAPGLMARMLETLALSDYHRVLEIGTGTGYNAALLCHRLCSDQVTTVEVDPAIAVRAQRALTEAGFTPTVIVGDGTTGHPDGGPYDRIIATVSVSRIPQAWIAQTKVGGVILANLHRELYDGALLRLSVAGGGGATGRFLPGYGSFMPVRSHPLTDTGSLLDAALAAPTADRRPTRLAESDLHDPDFGLLAALLVGGVATIGFEPDTGYQLWLLSRDGSWACLHTTSGQIEQHGDRRLWNELEDAHDRWRAWGRPGRDRFEVTIDADGNHHLRIDGRPNPVAVL